MSEYVPFHLSGEQPTPLSLDTARAFLQVWDKAKPESKEKALAVMLDRVSVDIIRSLLVTKKSAP